MTKSTANPSLPDVAPLLELVLLPKLDARSQLQLAATCRAARHWLFQLPKEAWQQVGQSPLLLSVHAAAVAFLQARQLHRHCRWGMCCACLT